MCLESVTLSKTCEGLHLINTITTFVSLSYITQNERLDKEVQIYSHD
uniref:Uncharacterized protein n=1 Tax=Rhizophora mucronata TaxID=61149 RepID=A0A2P2NTN8_RHIMU